MLGVGLQEVYVLGAQFNWIPESIDQCGIDVATNHWLCHGIIIIEVPQNKKHKHEDKDEDEESNE